MGQEEYTDENDIYAPLRGLRWLIKNTPIGLMVLLCWCMIGGSVPTIMFLGEVALNVFQGK